MQARENSKHNFQWNRIYYVLVSFFLILSCGMPTPTHVQTKIQLKHKIPKHSQLLDSKQPTPFAPLQVDAFSCYFINIMGSGIGNWDTYASGVQQNLGYSYFSLFSKTVNISKGSSFEIEIPNGSQRIIQALGVVSTKTCPGTLAEADIEDDTVFKAVFELSRAVLDINQDMNIIMTSSYDPFKAKDARILLNSKFASIDNEAPVPGLKIQSTKLDNSIHLTWGQAKDNGTPSNYLLYKLLTSASVDAVNTVEKAESAGMILVDWILNLTSYTGTYANGYIVYTVLVKDAAGNIAQYTPLEVFGVPELSYQGVNGALTLGVAVNLTPSTLKTNGTAITSCSVKSGSGVRLPSWASINQSTCVIHGTPNALLSSETLTIIANSSAGSSEGATITLSVQSP